MPRTPKTPSLRSVGTSPFIRRLRNGARIFCAPAAADAPVSIQLWVAAGAGAERQKEHGCAHLLEHMLFKPFAKEGPEGDLALLIEGLGGDVNAFTSHDETVLYATVPASVWGEALDGILWSGLRPEFRREELEREREVVVEEIKQYYDDPGSRAAQMLLAQVHADHSYGRPVLGTPAEVRGHTARRLRAFHRRVYAGARLTLVVVGPVDPKSVVARAMPVLGQTPEANPLPVPGAVMPPMDEKIRATVRRADVSECHLLVGWRAPGLDHPDIAAFDVLALVLGSGDASRLVCDVRRRAQLVTDIHGALDVGREESSLTIAARTGVNQIVGAYRAIQHQIRRLATMPMSIEEFSRARVALESDLVYRGETVQGQGHALGYYATMTDDRRREQRYYRELSALTPEAVQTVAARWLPSPGGSLTALLPEARVDTVEARRIRRELLAGGRARSRRAKASTSEGITAVDLECGLRLRLLRDPSVPVAGAWLVWLGGLRAEPAAHAGLASITAETLARGNALRDGDSLSREIEGLAGSLDGFAGRSSLGIHGEGMARHIPRVLEHLLECALTPRFPDDEVAEARRIAIEEVTAADDLGQVAIQELRKLLYDKHPYSRPLRGTRAGLRTIDGPLLRENWRRNYPIGQAVLGIAGDIDLGAVREAVEARCENSRRRGRRWRPEGGPPKPLTRPRRKTIRKDREQAHIAIGFPGLVLGDPRVPALEVLCALLGGQSGRLFLALREEEGLVYTVDAGATEGIDGGDVTIYAATSHDKLGRALAAIELHLARVATELIDEPDLERAKAWLIGQHAISLQRRSAVASELAFAVACGLPAIHYRGYQSRIEGVTSAAVLQVARLLLDPRRQAIVIVTREGVDVRAGS